MSLPEIFKRSKQLLSIFVTGGGKGWKFYQIVTGFTFASTLSPISSKFPLIKYIVNMIIEIKEISSWWALAPIILYIIVALAVEVWKLQGQLNCKINAYFDGENGCVKTTIDTATGMPNHNQIFYRLKVTSTSSARLKNCQATIKNIEYKNKKDGFTSVYSQSLFLSWAHHNTSSGDRRSIEIAGNEDFHYLDVIYSSENDNDIKLAIYDRESQPVGHYAGFFKNIGIYQVIVLVTSESSLEAKKVCLEIDWNGNWDQIKVSQVNIW